MWYWLLAVFLLALGQAVWAWPGLAIFPVLFMAKSRTAMPSLFWFFVSGLLADLTLGVRMGTSSLVFILAAWLAGSLPGRSGFLAAAGFLAAGYSLLIFFIRSGSFSLAPLIQIGVIGLVLLAAAKLLGLWPSDHPGRLKI